MKIYASTSTNLDKFIGKDLWVLVLKRGGGKYWVHILRKERNEYLVNAVPRAFADYSGFTARDVNFYSQHTIRFFTDELILVQPIEILTTEEMFENRKEDI